MDKESPVISWIKNRILLIFSRFKKNTEAGIGEDKEQLIDHEEKSSEKKEEVPTSISEVLRKWLEFDEKIEKFDEMVEKGRNEILKDRKDISNKIIEGISGLEDEYDKRLKDLKTSIEEDYDKRLIDLKTSIIEELKKKKEEGAVSDFITFKEDLEKIRDLAETVKSKKKLEKLMKIPIGELKEKIEKIEKIAGMKLSDISDDIEKINKASLEKMGMIDDIGLTDFSDAKFIRLKLILDTLNLVPERKKDIPKQDEGTIQSTDHSHPVTSHSLDDFKERIDEINIQLSYDKGVKLLKEGDFERAYKCFDEITESNPDNFKEAWLNRGFALGKLGDVDQEIKSYKNAIKIDKNYEKASHNMKIAERKSWIKKKWEEILRRIPF